MKLYWDYIHIIKFEMETGTYLTEIDFNQRTSSAPKFKRCNTNKTQFADFMGSQIKKKSKINIQKHGTKNYKFALPQEYYEGKLIKPGTQIYRIILQAEDRREKDHKIPHLQLSIPQTMVLSDASHSLIYSHNGCVKVIPEFTYNSFVKLAKENSQKDQMTFPAAMLTNGSSPIIDHYVFISNQLDTRIIPKSQNQACIRFIQPYMKYPNVLRLFYVPKTIRGSKPNIGYKIVNKRLLDDQIISRKHKQIHHYIVSDSDKVENVSVTVVKGKALEEVQRMAQSLINYVQYVKQIKITELVIDFTFNNNKRYQFHEIKSVKSHSLSKIWQIGTTQQIIDAVKQQNNQILCKLCGFQFPKNQMGHLVTNKLIMELISHLKVRGEDISSFAMLKPNNLSASCHVCHLCYELVLAEHQLIDIQHQFCQILNIDSSSINRVPELVGSVNMQKKINQQCMTIEQQGVSQKHIIRNAQNQMYEWRIFFYLQKLKNLPLEFQQADQLCLTMSFKGFKQSFHKKILKTQVKNIIFDSARIKNPLSNGNRKHKIKHYTKNNKITQHTNHTTTFTNRSHDCLYGLMKKQSTSINMQKAKLFMFYTSSPSISHILQKQELKVELQFGPYKMKGQSSTFRNFSNSLKCQQHSCEVLLFDNEYKYCNLQLNVGIICNKKVDSSAMNLIRHQPEQTPEDQAVYFPSKLHRNCDPLPQEWIQIINNGPIVDQENEVDHHWYHNQTFKLNDNRYSYGNPKSNISYNYAQKDFDSITRPQSSFLQSSRAKNRLSKVSFGVKFHRRVESKDIKEDISDQQIL